MNDFANLRTLFGHPDAAAVAERLSEPGALTASLNIYRANVHPRTLVAPPLEFPLIAAPTMAVWSDRDVALVEQGVTGSAEYVSGPFRYERIDGVGHFIPLEAPDHLNRLLLDFLPRTVVA